MRLALKCHAMKAVVIAMLLGISDAHAASSIVNNCLDRAGRPVLSDTKPTSCTSPSDEEIDAAKAAKEKVEADAKAKLASARRDRALLAQYPGPDALESARNRELLPLRERLEKAKRRLALCAAERKLIDNELEFHPDGILPEQWQQRRDMNNAQVTVQIAVLAGLPGEMSEINGVYDSRLARLRELWPMREASAKAASGVPRR